MSRCFFVSDLHGCEDRYRKLFAAIEMDSPAAVFLGGDLVTQGIFRTGTGVGAVEFIEDVLGAGFEKLRSKLGNHYPQVFLILGNDDVRAQESHFQDIESRGLWHYVHARRLEFGRFRIYGYSYVPPTPFRLKDWERYDVSAYVDPGCIPPEEGLHSIEVEKDRLKYSTIQKDLEDLAGQDSMEAAIFLCHSPPYRTNLDRAALDGKMVDHVPLDVNVGSIALRRFIELRQPLLTLHGHVHEAARLTGSWRDRIGRTHMFSAAHDGPELALIRFDPQELDAAIRQLL